MTLNVTLAICELSDLIGGTGNAIGHVRPFVSMLA